MQKISSIHTLIHQILGSHELNDHACLTRPNQESLKKLLDFLNLHQHAKNQFLTSIHSWDTANFRVLWSNWPHPFLTMPIIKFFNELLILWICINMQKIRLFHWFFLEIWLIEKSCNLIGWEQFDPHLKNQKFPKYGICARTQQII